MAFDQEAFADLYPFKGKRIPVSGHTMHVLDEGEGETLVFLHGNPTWSFMWRDLVKALEPHYRCIVPDHVGMGLSDKPSAKDYPYTLERRVKDLQTLLEQLEVKPPLTLVAHDWGGMIGLADAVTRPGWYGRFVLFNTAGFGLPRGRSLPFPLGLVRDLPMGWLVQGFNAFARGAVLTCSRRKGGLPPRVAEALLAPYDSYDHRVSVYQFVRDIPLKPSDPAFALVETVSSGLESLSDCPAFIGWGGKDFVFDRSFLLEWLERWPHAEAYVMPEAGHYVLEDALPELLPPLLAFLQQHPAHQGKETDA